MQRKQLSAPGPAKRGAIHNFILRVPGLSQAEARTLGQEVAGRLLQNLPEGAPKQIGVLNLRVAVPQGTRQDQLAAHVARAITRAIE